MKVKLVIALAIFASCKVADHLHNSGKYVVVEIINKQPGITKLKLQGISRPFIFYNDTLKVNDTVFINVLNTWSKKINVVTAK